MFRLLLVILCTSAAIMHFAYESPAGYAPYVFLLFLTAVCARLTIRTPSDLLLTLSGAVLVWFIVDYGIYGTFLSCYGLSTVTLPVPMEEAYQKNYAVASIAIAGFGGGLFFGRPRGPVDVDTPKYDGRRLLFWVHFAVAAGGIVGIAVLLSDPQIRADLLFNHTGINVPVGMGKFSALVFVLPTALIGLWYASGSAGFSRLGNWALILLLLASSLHLAQGRRLVWASSVLMGLHLLERAKVFALRWWHVALATPLLIAISVFFEDTKNSGLLNALTRFDPSHVLNAEHMAFVFRNSVGRFDISAAIISNRLTKGYYWGSSFAGATLQLLPAGWGFPRPIFLKDEIGQLVFGDSRVSLASQATSFISELYANFDYPGVFFGFLLLGWFCSRADTLWRRDPRPVVAVMYGLCLFRLLHQLVTESAIWLSLSTYAFLPWAVGALLAVLAHRRITSEAHPPPVAGAAVAE